MDHRPARLSNYSSAIWGVGFRYWITGVLSEMRRKSPVQKWVESIPKNDSESKDLPSCDIANSNRDSASVSVEQHSINDEKHKQHDSVQNDECGNNECDLDHIHKHSNGKISESNDDIKPPEIITEIHKTADDIKFETNQIGIDVSSKTNKIDDSAKSETDQIDEDLCSKNPKVMLFRDRSTTSEGNSPRHRYPFFRDSSFHSEGARSRCSSVESLLESRKVDAEAVLRSVGFGPSPSRQQLSRIPDRFLKPSQVKGIDTDKFIKEEQRSMKMHECGIFGYRGLTGNPHIPPSTIVAKIIERISSSEEFPEPDYYTQ